MQIVFHKSQAKSWKTDCLLVPTFSGVTPPNLSPSAVSWLKKNPAYLDHTEKNAELSVCYGPASSRFSRVLAVRVGTLESCTPGAIRSAFAAALRHCQGMSLGNLSLALKSVEKLAAALKLPTDTVLQEILMALFSAAYRYTSYRTKYCNSGAADNGAPFSIATLSIITDGAKKTSPGITQTAKRAEAVAAGLYRTRDLVNGPGNVITPARMAEEAKAIARQYSFGCKVLLPSDMTRLGMGALMAVAQGSRQEPRFIILEHAPHGAKHDNPIVLVGKGITFDTGGISLKPAADMHRMKSDMAGAAAVLGVFEAIGQLPGAVQSRVIGLIPCAENMPGGAATRPGDIVTTMRGSTVEIINTDAEGRLILCDALTYAQKEWTPAALVDIATLTGACAVALGRHAGGVFSTCARLREHLVALGDETGDTLWPMPLWDALKEELNSPAADIANTGSREGGAITAALFLKHFVEDPCPWAHLDIAGPGFAAKGSALCPVGGSGFGMRALYELTRRGPAALTGPQKSRKNPEKSSQAKGVRKKRA